MRTLFYFSCLLVVLTAATYKTVSELDVAKHIIALQDSLLKDACEHASDRHDCDCPWMDTDKPILINELKSRL